MEIKNSLRIVKKDWKASIRTKEIIFPMIIIPIIFTIIVPLLISIGVIVDPDEYLNSFGDIDLIKALLNIPTYYNDHLVGGILVIKMFMLPIFLLIPGLLPIIISSDSFAGEKERKTMENLALLPITKKQLIIGKVLASFIPSIIISFSCFTVIGIIFNIIFLPYLEGNLLLFSDISSLLVGFLLSPLMAFLNIQISVIISSRSKDLKSAQSLAGALVTPVIGILLVQIFNPAFLSPLMVFIISILIGLLCLIFVKIASKLLNIEKLILML